MSTTIARTLDLKGLSCPMPIVKTAQQIKELASGDLIEALATDPGSVADFKAWAEENGALFRDDTGDSEMTLDLYEDGDHVADRRRYTDIFRKRLDALFR